MKSQLFMSPFLVEIEVKPMLKNKQISFHPVQEHEVRFNRLIFGGLPEEMSGPAMRRGYIRCPLSTLTEERQAKPNVNRIVGE